MNRKWTENGYEMAIVDGVVMVNDHGNIYKFIKWVYVGDKVYPMINITVK